VRRAEPRSTPATGLFAAAGRRSGPRLAGGLLFRGGLPGLPPHRYKGPVGQSSNFFAHERRAAAKRVVQGVSLVQLQAKAMAPGHGFSLRESRFWRQIVAGLTTTGEEVREVYLTRLREKMKLQGSNIQFS